jgi:HJR/Mrr/RecB family endonuclease
VDDFLSQVADLMERELVIASELSEQVREAMAHDEFSHSYLRHSTHLRQYEYRLPRFGVPSNLEALVESALYAIYVAQSPGSKVVIPDSRADLVRALAVSEETLRLVTPRRFEEMVAYIYELLGCRTMLTQYGPDWGADILAWQPGPFGTESLVAVQVKLYSPGRRVDLAGVHGLHGAVTHYNAHHGHLVATTDLTRPASEFMSSTGYHYIDLQALRREIERLLP